MDQENGNEGGCTNNMFNTLASSFQAYRHTSLEQQQSLPATIEFGSLAPSQAGKRKNNVWVEVAKEEEIQNTANQFDVISVVDKFKINRGPESYVVGDKRVKRKRPAPSETVEEEDSSVDGTENKRHKWDTDMDHENDGDGASYESDSSISSSGLSDDCKGNMKARTAEKKMRLLKSHVTSSVPKKKRTSREIMEGEMSKLEDWQVANYIGNRLKEKKKSLIQRTMRCLGREETLKLFWKTLKIERSGGLKIKNKSRRRTPGGVFLYLLRSNKKYDQTKVHEIFKEERDVRKIEKKVTRLEKDAKYIQHISKLVRKQYNTGNTKVENEMHTDSEEEELEDSYEVPKPVPAVSFMPLSKPNFNFSETATAEKAENPAFLPSQTERGIRSKHTLISYGGDDDFLDIHCDEEELF